MNREEAIEHIRSILEECTENEDAVCYVTSDNADAFGMAIKALERRPCEDAISREAMFNYQQYLQGRMSNEENYKLWEFIKNLPSVVPTPKKCHNENHDYAGCDQFVCSNCGIELQDWHRAERDEDDGDITYHEYEFRFCPNCGAKVKDDEL